MRDLQGMKVLIVEDNWFQASELARYFQRHEAKVLGPVSTVSAALPLARIADAAVLDIDLGGTNVFPVADVLSERNIPYLFFTGADSVSIPERFRFVDRFRKPLDLELMSSRLYSHRLLSENLVTMLPMLRLTARLMTGDGDTADRLVERTLRRALEDFDERPEGDGEIWLIAIMRQIMKAERGNLMT